MGKFVISAATAKLDEVVLRRARFLYDEIVGAAKKGISETITPPGGKGTKRPAPQSSWGSWGSTQKRCHSCNQYGHKAAKCPKWNSY